MDTVLGGDPPGLREAIDEVRFTGGKLIDGVDRWAIRVVLIITVTVSAVASDIPATIVSVVLFILDGNTAESIVLAFDEDIFVEKFL